MINTKRVFYIYSYKNGRRDRNVGFAKIKKRDNDYRLNLTIKLPVEYKAEQMHVCLYKRENGEMIGYKLGILNPFNETCKFNTNIVTERLLESGFYMDDVAGVYIFGGEHECYVFSAEINQTEEWQQMDFEDDQRIHCIC